jgi:hypothetical protein
MLRTSAGCYEKPVDFVRVIQFRIEAIAHGRKRCRMHGGAEESGAPRANQNARKHGLFTKDAIAERRRIRDLLGEARELLEGMK